MSYWEEARQRLEAGEHYGLVYQDYSDRLAAACGNDEEERLLDVLDALTGWCSPQWDLSSYGR